MSRQESASKSSIFLNIIGIQLMFRVVLFVLLITIALTAIELFIDYRSEVKAINQRVDSIEGLYKADLENGLWTINISTINAKLDEIKRLPDINAVVLEEKQSLGDALRIQKGSPEGKGIIREYPLTYIEGIDLIPIGDLYVEATLNGVYQRLLDKSSVLFAVQLIRTTLLAFFVMFIYYRLVTRHLAAVTQYLKTVDLTRSGSEELKLSKKVRGDDLDRLTNACNALVDNYSRAYEKSTKETQSLQEKIAARKQFEEERKRQRELKGQGAGA